MAFIIRGQTFHQRLYPKKHAFSYPLTLFYIDILNPQSTDHFFPFFAFNRWALFSFFDQDFLKKNDQSLSQKAFEILRHSPYFNDIKKLYLCAMPRFFHNPFRPITLYFAYNEHQELLACVAEVTNTYKERHAYLLNFLPQDHEKKSISKKVFHVSPFFDEKGDYHFNIDDSKTSLCVQITYYLNQKKIFYADIKGKKINISKKSLFYLSFKKPFSNALIYPRILYQAFKLYYQKKISAKPKPKPKGGPFQIRPMPASLSDTIFLSFFSRAMKRCNKGYLKIILPDGKQLFFGDANDPELNVDMTVHHYWLFKDLVFGGELALGESYVSELWDSSDVHLLLRFFIANRDQISQLYHGRFTHRLLAYFQHKKKKNKLKNSRKNIQAHYDLGNEFYSLFLDPSLTYSSAYFKNGKESLEQAQQQKIDRLLAQLDLSQDDHVLEIGSGWGTLGLRLLEQYSSKFTSITLSQEQYQYILTKIKERKLQNRFEILLKDYRLMRGHFDALVSVEMIEAVGREYLDLYFQQCATLLKTKGRFALQAITYPEKHYERYQNSSDFIKKHIFPGGHLPTLCLIKKLAKRYGLILIDELNIGQSYAKTLHQWDHSFFKNKKNIQELGFDDLFIRKWHYYFKYCEAGFSSDFLGTYQLIFQKA